MKNTINYSLKKPEVSDYVNITDINYNMDVIDTEIKNGVIAIQNHLNNHPKGFSGDYNDLTNKPNIGQMFSDINSLNFELKLNNIIANNDLRTVYVDKIDSSNAITLISGKYSDGKVSI